ncbi:hypothetical protein [Thalassotalea eurytherma]|uniref:Uncharacterized protein n=1 Tax=Thalassotalea eurytherma TaxID=1144278 RepID=A0ABQ6H3T7_9GAMM|nr:hypothetical protein [Thalassotalea eurytherma]GLX82833.1 hypothetical protein theurythT_22850 [Thalassotalea eurytherma]
MAKTLNVILFLMIVLLGYSNYQQGNKIAELYIKNAQLANQINSNQEAQANSIDADIEQPQVVAKSIKNDSLAAALHKETQHSETVSDSKVQANSPLKALQSPEMQEMMQSDFMKQQLKYQMKNRLPPLYEALFDELQLDDAQRETLMSLIIDEQIVQTQYAMEYTYQSSEEKQDFEPYQESEDYQKSLEVLIGPSGVESYKAYEKSLPLRQELIMFNAHTSPDLVLSSEQMNSMIDSVTQIQEPDDIRDSMDMMSLVQEGKLDEVRDRLMEKQQKTLEQSANILTEQQQASYQTYLNQQMQMQIAGLKMMANM